MLVATQFKPFGRKLVDMQFVTGDWLQGVMHKQVSQVPNKLSHDPVGWQQRYKHLSQIHLWLDLVHWIPDQTVKSLECAVIYPEWWRIFSIGNMHFIYQTWKTTHCSVVLANFRMFGNVIKHSVLKCLTHLQDQT